MMDAVDIVKKEFPKEVAERTIPLTGKLGMSHSGVSRPY